MKHPQKSNAGIMLFVMVFFSNAKNPSEHTGSYHGSMDINFSAPQFL
jgi:hypothetical protein